MAASNEFIAIKSIMRFDEAIKAIFDLNTADVEFQIIEDGKETVEVIRAHKKWLSAISPVFRSMFDGNWSEMDTVKIIDANYDIFKEFVQYLYGREVEIRRDNFETLLYLAKKYIIGDLLSSCVAYIDEHLSVDNAAHSLNLVVTYDLDSLRAKCEQIIKENTAEVLETESFHCCDTDTLVQILQLDQVSCSEAVIFDACFEWAKRKCEDDNIETSTDNLLKALGKCFNLIRFKEMESDDFIKRSKLHSGKLFQHDDLHDLMVYFVENKNSTPKRRQREVPKSTQNPELIFEFKAIKGKVLKKFPNEAVCEIHFSVSKPLLFIGYTSSNVFLETTNGKTPEPYNEFYQLAKQGIILSNHRVYVSFDYDDVFTPFDKANQKILIEAGIVHKLTLRVKPETAKYSRSLNVYEIKSQTLNGIELKIEENHSAIPNEIQFISELHFEEFSTLEQEK